MRAAEIDGHSDGEDSLQIADGAVDYQAAGFGGGEDGSGEVVADDSALIDFAKQVDHEDITGLELIDDALVLGDAADTAGLGVGFGHLHQVGAGRA